jgi:5'-nucleotidase
MSIAVDIDGVIADLLTRWLHEYNRDYQDVLQPSDIVGWDTHLFVKPECGTKIYDYIKRASIYKRVKPIEGALEAINKLREYGFRILFVTAFEPKFSYAKFDWLNKWGFNVLKNDYIECGDKSLIIANALIDDNYNNIISFPETGILFDAPYNKQYDYKTRVKGWNQVLDFIVKNPPQK